MGPPARRDGQGLLPRRPRGGPRHDRPGAWGATSCTSPARTPLFAGPDNVAYGAAKADQAHQVRLLAAELGEHGIRVNGINPDGVVRGSGIFAGGWGAQRAAVYGVPEDELGAFYAQRTLLRREVLPEHVAAAVIALTAGDLALTTGLHIPVDAGSRRRLPALSRADVAAVDLGATSGRVVIVRLDARPLELEPVHRFPTPQVAGRAARWRGTSTPCSPRSRPGWSRRPARPAGVGGRRRVGRRLRPPRAAGRAARAGARVPLDAHRRRHGRGHGSGRPEPRSTGAPASSSSRSTPSTSSSPPATTPEYRDAAHLLMVPDLVNHALCGSTTNDVTNASTTQLLDADHPAWSDEVVDLLGLRRDLLPDLHAPGTTLGPVPGVDTPSTTLPVVAAASHDTASAVAGIAAGPPTVRASTSRAVRGRWWAAS